MNDDGDDKDDSKRRTRNLSEKKRRDQFNLLVNELGSMVSGNNRKMDKSTVLKSTISFLRNHNEVTIKSRAHDVQEDWKPGFLSNEEFTYLLLEALEGFIMTFSPDGRIGYVSESIIHLVGHHPSEIVNKNLFDYVYEGDRSNVYEIMQNHVTVLDPSETLTKENETKFHCHIRRGSLDENEEPSYELIQFSGYFRASKVENVENDEAAGGSHHRVAQDADQSLIFVCTGRLYTPQLIRDVTLVDCNRNEFTSRHSLEWKFLFLDHRAPPIIGYLPFEVLGTSGYDYYHFDDLEKVVSCHEALMQKGELTSCYYRFLTKGQQWIWLQSRFYITYHQWNSKPEFVVCTHRVVSPRDVENTKQEGPKDEEVDVDPVDDVKESPEEETTGTMSPSYPSETSDSVVNSYQPLSQPESVKSVSAGSVSCASTTSTVTWARNTDARYNSGSDTASISGESRSSQRTGSREEQLQQKHEELQQMIVRQQEELRQVKEQLLFARFGILQPVINVPSQYITPEDMQQAQRIPTQLVYDSSVRPMIPAFSSQHHQIPLHTMHPQLQSLPQLPHLQPHLNHAHPQHFHHLQTPHHSHHLQHPQHPLLPPPPTHPPQQPHSSDHHQ